MLGQLFGRGAECGKNMLQSCDIMWIIILLLVVFNGGLFGLDICTLVILFVVFGGQFLCKDKHEHRHECRCAR